MSSTPGDGIAARGGHRAPLASPPDDSGVEIEVEAGDRLSSEGDLQLILEESLQTAVAVSDTEMGLLSLYDMASGCLEVGATQGLDGVFLAALGRISPGMGACGTCLERRQRVVVEDTEIDPLFAPFREGARQAGFRSVHSTPLMTRAGRCIGVLSTLARLPRRPSERETRLMDLCARQVVDAIENARLYRRAQEEIARRRQVEERLAIAQRAASVGTWDWDLVTGKVAWSEGLFHLLGLQPGDLDPSEPTWLGLIHPEDLAATLRASDEAIRRGGDFHAEFRIRQEDGTYRWIASKGTVVHTPQGKPIRFLGANYDITARRQAAAALEESEERLRNLADNLPAGFIYQVVDAPEEGRRLSYVSGGIQAVCGLTSERVLAEPDRFHALILEEDAAQVRAAEEAAFRSREALEVQFRLRVGGQVRWLHCRSAPRQLSEGKVVWDGIALDVTERKRAEGRLEAVLASIDDHLVCYDRQWRYTFVNDRAAVVLHKTKEELLGHCIWELFPNAVGNEYYRQLHRARDEQRPIQFTFYYEPFQKWFENHIYPAADGVTVYAADVTDRRRAEQLLERYRLLSQYARDIVLFLRTDGSIVEANDAAVAAYGYSRDVFLRMTIFDLRDPATTSVVPRQLFQADGEGVTFETLHRRRDGSTFPVEVSSRGAEVAGERLLLSIIRDITERRRAEQETRDLAERLALALAAAGMGNWSWDAATDRVSFSERAAAILGVSAESHPSWSRILESLHEEDRESVRRKLQEAVSGSGDFDAEFRVRHLGDSRVWVSARGRATLDDEGRLLGMTGVMQDITARKEAEEAVRRSETRYRKLFEESALAVQVFSPDGRLVRANRAWERLWGATFAELRDYNLHLDPQLEALGLMPLIRRAFAGEVVEFPPTTYVPDRGNYQGQRRSVRSFMYPVKADCGRVEELVLLQEDITEQTRAMEALEEANRRKDQFLAMLAHELRNPLAPVSNALEIMRMPNAPPAVLAQAREMAERQVGHMGRLVDDLLEVSRITRGKIKLRKEAIDLVQVVSRAAEAGMAAFQARWQELRLALPLHPIHMLADPARLEQVFVNLLTNSAKYTPPGGKVWVTVSLEGEQAEVRVRDDGVGISSELLPRIFDLFVQAEQGPDRAQGGLGIGLTLVRSLVEMHEGTVEARSEGAGCGSEFIVRLPRIARLAEPGEQPSPAPRQLPARSKRVLVVDDNRDSAESMALLLQLQGHEVRTAHNGATALAAAEEFAPEAVLLDIGLPGMDGYEVARRLRARERGSRTLLIALTGYGQEEDRRRSSDAGFDHHLVKPADPGAVEMILSGGSPR